MDIEKTFTLATLSFTLWSTLALLADRRGPVMVNRWFAGLVFLLAIAQGFFYVQGTAAPSTVFYWAVVAQATLWLKGPITLALVHITLGRPVPAVCSLHVLPFCVAILDLWLGSSQFLFWGIAGTLHALAYLARGTYLLYKARGRLRTITEEYPNSAYYWLLWVLAGLAFMIIIDLVLLSVSVWRGEINIELFKPVSWLLAGYLCALAFCIIYRPELFFKNHTSIQSPPLENHLLSPSARLKLVVNRDPVDKNWRELNEPLAQALSHSLSQLMDAHIYRQHELTLNDLAVRLGISVHQASELLNVHIGQSFYDFINQARLAYACQRLADPLCQQRVIDIAFEAGFSNKNSFYRYFRETYGITPVEFRTRAAQTGAAPSA